MSAADPKDSPITLSSAEAQRLFNVPQGSNVRIHFENAPQEVMQAAPVKKPMEERSLYAIIAGAIGAVVGYIASNIYVERKMFEFNNEVASKTKNSILGRGGLGAGVAEGGAALTGFGAGTAGHAIANGHARELVASGEHGFASFIYRNFGGNHGWIPMTTAAVTGLAAAGLYLSTHPKKETHATGEQPPKEWKDKLAAEPEKPRTLE